MRRPIARTRRPEPDSEPVSPEMDAISLKTLQLRQSPNSKSNSFSKSQKHQQKSNLLCISFVFISFSIIFYLLFAFFRSKTPEIGPKFGIIIDGGSTGTRIHVFEYRTENGAPKFDFGPKGHWSMRVNPGLSSFSRDPEKAGGSLEELLEFGRGRVPRECWRETEVRLMATAGLRLVGPEVQGRVLEACRRVLRGSGFKFRDEWASVITGSDEGLYAWVVANYALGTLGGDPHQTSGIVELGGASAQVTFASSELVPPEFSRTLRYGNVTYNLYSNSLLHFGQNVAFDSLKDLLISSGLKMAIGSAVNGLTLDPCTPKGFAQDSNSFNHAPNSLSQKFSSTFHASGNFSECRAAALMLLQKGKEACSYHHCTLGSTFVPKLHGRFLATENFFHTSQFFGLSPRKFLSNLIVAGQHFCEEHWSNIRRKHSSYEEEDLVHYCFSSAYIVALLHDSLGIALDDERIGYANQVNNIPLDWALGAFILQSTDGIDVKNHGHGWNSSLLTHNFPNLSLLLIAAILLFVASYVLQWKKPYFKTIYDLEKGRYIVTRINR